jgi:hypothetical protein
MPKQLRKYRVAVIHYWFFNRRGGEQIVDAILKLFPKPICTRI